MPAELDGPKDWFELTRLAALSKTVGLLIQPMSTHKIAAPEETVNFLKRKQEDLLKSGLFNLGWTIKAANTLENAGIQTLAFKGAIQTQAVYRSWDKRSSSDIDLLVRPADFSNAAEALEADGYIPVFSLNSKWWREHLGELPFRRVDGSGVVVDLHQRVQQPGGPVPAKMESFFLSSQIKHYGDSVLRVPSREHSTLIAAIGYGKAVRAGMPWLHHAHEIAMVHSLSSSEQIQKTAKLAIYHKLDRLYTEALTYSREIFGHSSANESRPADGNFKELLRSSMGLVIPPRFYRSQKLWAWLDGGPILRSSAFASGLVRVFRSQAAQRLEERQQALSE